MSSEQTLKMRDLPRPLYRQIGDTIKRQILSGVLKPHQKLDSEHLLMAAYGVSRMTVRQALRDLRGEGLVFSAQGKGTFVTRPKATQSLQSLEGFEEAMAAGGFAASSRVVSVRARPPTEAVRDALSLDAEDEVLEVKRVRCLNQEPVSIDLSYFPMDIGARLLHLDLARDLFPLLESDLGIALGFADLKVGAAQPDEEARRLLCISHAHPLLSVERLTQAVGGRPVDFEYLLIRGDAYQYQFRVQHRARKAPA